jgi:chromosome segregation ATPase
LRWNNGGWLGGKALAEAMRWNTTILSINIVGNDIPESIGKTIRLGLERNAKTNNSARHERTLRNTLDATKREHSDEIQNLKHEISKLGSAQAALEKQLVDAETRAISANAMTSKVEARLQSMIHERDVVQQSLKEIMLRLETEKTHAREKDEHRQMELLEWKDKYQQLESQKQTLERNLVNLKRQFDKLKLEADNSKDREEELEVQIGKLRDVHAITLREKLNSFEKVKDVELGQLRSLLAKKAEELNIMVETKEHDVEVAKRSAEAKVKLAETKAIELEAKLHCQEVLHFPFISPSSDTKLRTAISLKELFN